MDRNEQLEYLLDHHQNPRNSGSLPDADARAQGGHPGCSDVVTVYLKVKDDRIADIRFEGEGCTISQAGASIMTEEVLGKTLDEVAAMNYHTVIAWIGAELVSTRPRCATLGLDTVKAAVNEYRRRQITGD